MGEGKEKMTFAGRHYFLGLLSLDSAASLSVGTQVVRAKSYSFRFHATNLKERILSWLFGANFRWLRQSFGVRLPANLIKPPSPFPILTREEGSMDVLRRLRFQTCPNSPL